MFEPVISGPESYRNLVVTWGSMYHIVEEALQEARLDETAHLHFDQVFPLHPGTAGHLKKAERVIAVEGNATGQFADLIRRETGFLIEDRILWYSGLQVPVEKVAEKLIEMLR